MQRTPKFPGLVSTADGSNAVVWVESHISQAACVCPITPATAMGDAFARKAAGGERNLWEEPLVYLEAESQQSAASACEGFALSGGRVTSFTSGQGLVHMKTALHVMAGKRLPVVFHVGTRALTSQALNVHAGHDDVMGVANAGWGMLFARNAQEAADLALIARRAAELSETPFLVAQDGFLTTHTLESVRLPEPPMMKLFVGTPNKRLRTLFNPRIPLVSGPVQQPDAYMKGRVAQRFFYERVRPALATAMDDYFEFTGRHYSLIHQYRMEDAEYAVVGIGSLMDTAEVAVDWLREQGTRAGAVSITAFRPFPEEELIAAIGQCRAIAVVERTDVPLAEANPLTLELKAALASAQMGEEVRLFRIPEVYSGVAGLGGSPVRPGHLVAAIQNMQTNGRRFFVLGINHPEALGPVADTELQAAGTFAVRGFAKTGARAVAAHNLLGSVIPQLFGLQVQAFTRYNSERQRMPASFSVTFAEHAVRMHAEPALVDMVAIERTEGLEDPRTLDGLRPCGMVYLETALPAERVWESLPVHSRRVIQERNISLWITHEGLAGIPLLGVLLRLAPFAERAGWHEPQLFSRLEIQLTRALGVIDGRRPEDVLASARAAYGAVMPITVPPETHTVPVPPRRRPAQIPDPPTDDELIPTGFCDHVVESYLRGRESRLEADVFAARGLMPQGTGWYRSFRHLSAEVPRFLPEACDGCMECVNLCPDAAILARVVERKELEGVDAALCDSFAETGKFYQSFVDRGQVGGLFGLAIDLDRCKGCGLCVVVCADKALEMVGKSSVDLDSYDRLRDLFAQLPDTPARFLSDRSLGDLMLSSFAHIHVGGGSSCVGCGETALVRLVLAATGFVYGAGKIGLVAASGCTNVFGATYPFNPYVVPWTSSLLDNAPSEAMGIRMRWNQEGHADRRLWLMGGDEVLLDVGFHSFSRLLASGLDVNALLIDTRVHRPAGHDPGPSAAALALAHPGVFLAQTTSAHLNHFYRSVMAANEFPGPAVVICYGSCMADHGIPQDQAVTRSRLAVDSRMFPLFTYDPRRGDSIRDRFNLQGNPAMDEDWYRDPLAGDPVDFVSFARTEGRFAGNFDSVGHPDDQLLRLQKHYLENWRQLQELAGVR